MSAITGAYLYNRFFQKEGQAYTGYFPVAEWNMMFQEAMIQAADQRYRNNQDQKANDELVSLITTENNIPVINNNMFYLSTLPVLNLTVVGTTWTLTTLLPHNVLPGQFIFLSGIAGFTPDPAGQYTVVTTPSPTTLTFTTTTATGTYTSNSGSMYLVNGQLTDYFHALAIKAYFLDPIYSNTNVPTLIVGATNATPIVVSVSSLNNNLRDGEQISISGITGNTNANGTFYIKKLNDLSFALYSDSALQTPVAGNGTYGGTPAINRVYFNYCTRILPDEKNSKLIKPTAKSPKYAMSNSGIKIYPLDKVCSQVTIDYKKRALNPYSNSTLFVDGGDNILDLTSYYNEKFLYNVEDLVLLMAAGETRDLGLNQFEGQQLTDNP